MEDSGKPLLGISKTYLTSCRALNISSTSFRRRYSPTLLRKFFTMMELTLGRVPTLEMMSRPSFWMTKSSSSAFAMKFGRLGSSNESIPHLAVVTESNSLTLISYLLYKKSYVLHVPVQTRPPQTWNLYSHYTRGTRVLVPLVLVPRGLSHGLARG